MKFQKQGKTAEGNQSESTHKLETEQWLSLSQSIIELPRERGFALPENIKYAETPRHKHHECGRTHDFGLECVPDNLLCSSRNYFFPDCEPELRRPRSGLQSHSTPSPGCRELHKGSVAGSSTLSFGEQPLKTLMCVSVLLHKKLLLIYYMSLNRGGKTRDSCTTQKKSRIDAFPFSLEHVAAWFSGFWGTVKQTTRGKQTVSATWKNKWNGTPFL